jgi:hypothetical protein
MGERYDGFVSFADTSAVDPPALNPITGGEEETYPSAT